MLSSMPYTSFPPLHVSSRDAQMSSFREAGKSMDGFLQEVRGLFEIPLQPRKLHELSQSLQDEFHQKLQSSSISMLPSYHHTLPTGHEKGVFLALDVGGSNFRLALVELTGTDGPKNGMHIKRNWCFAIDGKVRKLEGTEFFDWMAARIQDTLAEDGRRADQGVTPLSMGLAWSFPIEQTSRRSGSLLAMGKGFSATHGVEGQDLCDLIMTSCSKRGLNVELQSIVNDSSATLLSQAYRDSATRISLILGTGTNSAIYLPVSAIARAKFGDRSQEWHDSASHVLVNTELSMFGRGKLPTTRWDDYINETHSLPDFQPLEYKVGGRYLGEIVRLIVAEAVREFDLFGGEMPRRLDEPYALDTGIIAAFEYDMTASLSDAGEAFMIAHPLSHAPTTSELQFIQCVSRLVSTRAAAYEATAVHALWSLLTGPTKKAPSCTGRVTIACNGTVMEKYPAFRYRCQDYLDRLTVLSGAESGSVRLEMAIESSIYGAAVAVSCLD